MHVRASPALAFLALLAASTRAEDAAAIPQGWVKLETVGKIQVWVGDKAHLTSTGKSDFAAKLREMVDLFGKIYVLNRTSVRTAEGSKFPEKDRREVNLLLFQDDAAYDRWLLEGGKSLATVHEGRYLPTVGFPLVDGEVPAERWPDLAHLLSHVFIHHHFYFDPPLWLNEGLAEYFAWSLKKTRPTDFKAFNEMIDRLRVSKEKGEMLEPVRFFGRRENALSREEIDSAWVLVHLFATELNPALIDLTQAMGNLELMAMDGEKAVVDDLHRLARDLAGRNLGGERSLIDAWAFHRNALVASPTLPAKLRDKPKAVEAAGAFLAVGLSSFKNFYQDANGMQRKEAPFTGWVKPTLWWPGRITVNGSLGDGKDRWTEDFLVAEGFSTERGTPLVFKDKALPCGDQARNARIIVWWQVDGGGLYKVVKIEKLDRKK
jgi:hypothetical protein